MKYTVNGNDIKFSCDDFDLAETLDCGQAFRWKKEDNGFKGFALDKPLYIEQNGNEFTLKNVSEDEFLSFWKDYFDLDTDYAYLKKLYSDDKTLKSACEYAKGIRLLRQDTWETLISFIISQNNNIPRIKGIIENMCKMFGGFPEAKTLSSCTEDDIAPLRTGFRAKYILDAAKAVNDGRVVLSDLKTLPIEEARNSLMSIKGVGPKVAECVLLYGCYRV
ncbi:MAG: DNA-3-methyladenine glycosylase 2 family protein, partial [Oscillospiraceae bacterium]|nr:DNA-3-methyladenine glycosylase 2 family protein [Oscillospiraceae bacterium]